MVEGKCERCKKIITLSTWLSISVQNKLLYFCSVYCMKDYS